MSAILVFSFNEFGIDGGPSAKALKPKYELLTNHVTSNLGVQVPDIEVRKKFFLHTCLSLKS